MELIKIVPDDYDFSSLDWVELLSESSEPTCDLYSLYINRRAKKAKEAGDYSLYNKLFFLGQFTSMLLKEHSPKSPFEPLCQSGNNRSMLPCDLSDTQIAALIQILDLCPDSEIKARAADLIWIRKREIQYARAAIENYIFAAKKIEQSKYPLKLVSRLERALNLAKSIRKGNPEFFIQVIEAIETTIDRQLELDWHNNLCSTNIIEDLNYVLLNTKQGDAAKYIDVSNKLVDFWNSVPNSTMADKAYQLLGLWNLRANSPNGQKTALLESAKVLWQDAHRFAEGENPNLCHACDLAEKARERVKEIKEHKDFFREIELKLIYWKKQMARGVGFNMVEVGGSVTLPKVPIEKSANEISGKSLEEALLMLANLPLPNKSEYNNTFEESVFGQFTTSHHFDKADRLTTKVPPTQSDSVKGTYKAERSHLNQYNRIGYSVFILLSLKPRLDIIHSEHKRRIPKYPLDRILKKSSFILPARQELFAKGLLAGLRSEWAISLHLLIPQFENTIREHLRNLGVETMKVKDDGVLEERNLNELLQLHELDEMYGADMMSELKAMLIERTGSNLRNRICHGLMDSDEFDDHSCIYTWWLVLKLCLSADSFQNQAQ